MKTVVKLDYATFAFEQGSISIPKIEDALAQCDLHFAQTTDGKTFTRFWKVKKTTPLTLKGTGGKFFLLRGGFADNLLCIVF
jgi:hypothetical protein